MLVHSTNVILLLHLSGSLNIVTNDFTFAARNLNFMSKSKLKYGLECRKFPQRLTCKTAKLMAGSYISLQ